MRRLIVKYKEESRQVDVGSSAPSGQERANALNTATLRRNTDRQKINLSYLKSIGAQQHVMLSDIPLSRADMMALAKDVAKRPGVQYAEIDEWMHPHAFPTTTTTPNDTDYAAQQWNLKSPGSVTGGANVPNAWGLTVSGTPVKGAGVVVAVLDTGYRAHADVAANILSGYDFVSADPDTSFTTANDGSGRDADATDPGDWNTVGTTDCPASNSSWHGTRVAGIIAAVTDNNTGIAGIAYGAQVLPVRVMGICGGYTSDIAAGIQWAAGIPIAGVPNNTNVAKVINLSLGGGGTCSTTYQTAISAALAAGSVVIVSAGNDGSDTTLSQPANCHGVIAVTAHNSQGDLATYANIGTGTTISAPGGGNGSNLGANTNKIYSTSNTGATTPVADTYVSANGTSFSAPQVAAVAALMFQIKPTTNRGQITHYLTSTARAFPGGTYCIGRSTCGAGMLDAYEAAHAIQLSIGVPNSAPSLPAIGPYTGHAGTAMEFTLPGTDPDFDAINYSASALPAGAAFDTVTGVFTWSSPVIGTYTVTFTPNDGTVSGAARTATINVTAAPVASSSSGGGGGGSLGWADAVLALLLTLSSWALRKPLATRQ